MEAIKVNVSKQMDGYTFCILPSIRNKIKSWNPNFRPAKIISVDYEIKSGFEEYIGKFENWIYPVLLGIDDPKDLKEKVNEIQFVDSQTDKLLHSIIVEA